MMKVAVPKSRSREVVEKVIAMYERAGVDLRRVTLDEFKDRMSEVLRHMAG